MIYIFKDENYLINVATFKVHTTSITTLAVKNLQGCVPTGYGYMCSSWESLEPGARQWGINFKRDFHKDFYQRIEESFVKTLLSRYHYRIDYAVPSKTAHRGDVKPASASAR